MKILSIVTFAILSGAASVALGETDSAYQEIDESTSRPYIPPAAVEVSGEVRTVDNLSKPRLWGEGRPGSVRFGQTDIETDLCRSTGVEYGLSYAVIDWANTPAVCPIGTWVCTKNEIEGLQSNTARIDNTGDAKNCDREWVDYAFNDHMGWTADISIFKDLRSAYSESGMFHVRPQCEYKPVWCCSEYQP